MRILSLLAAALLIGLLALPVPASAQAFETIGTRALGMAGAFVAVADDATAAYWNPAGLANGAFLSLLVDHSSNVTRLDASRAGSPGTDEAATIIAMSTNSVAFSYYRLRINQIERPPTPGAASDPARNDQPGEAILRSVVTQNVAVTGAQVVAPGVSVGSTLRYVRGSHGVGPGAPGLATDEWLREAGGLQQMGQHKVDLDVGLMVGGQRLQAGMVARNLLEPSLEGPDGRSVRLDRQLRAGVSFRAAAGLRLAVDVDLGRVETAYGERRSLAVGAEHWFGPALGIRGGARFNLESVDDDSRPVGAFGLSLALTQGGYIDAQVTRGRDAIERGWSISGRVGF